MNKIVKFLRKHDYIVQVQELDKGIAILTPEKVIGTYIAPTATFYELSDGDKSGINSSNLESDTFYDIPKYALVPVLALEIQFMCKQLGYNHKYIYYTDLNGKEVEKIDLDAKITLGEAEKQKQRLLESIFTEQLAAGFKDNVTAKLKLFGIEEGYRILEKMYKE